MLLWTQKKLANGRPARPQYQSQKSLRKQTRPSFLLVSKVANCPAPLSGTNSCTENVEFSCDIQAPVVQKVDSAIHWINHFPVDNAISFVILIHWIAMYPADSAIQILNSRSQDYKPYSFQAHEKTAILYGSHLSILSLTTSLSWSTRAIL